MIRRILLMEFKAGVKDFQIIAVRNMFEYRVTLIEGVVAVEWGDKLNNKGCLEYSVIITFSNLETLNKYNSQKSVKHLNMMLNPILESVITFEYEVQNAFEDVTG